MAEENEEYRVKICLLGEFSVGKTSLIRRYVKDVFDDMYLITLGVKVTLKDVKLDVPKATYTLAIWDVGGRHMDVSAVTLHRASRQVHQYQFSLCSYKQSGQRISH
jgi:Ni2+-binding GTPase involved in maturation of urease and hydrogenase